MSLYGTKSEARNWATKDTKVFEKIVFIPGAASPCNSYNPEKDVQASIYGDDLKLVGEQEGVLSVEKDLVGRWTQTRKALVGPEDHHDETVLDLRRVVLWLSEGIEIEGDPRHPEVIIIEADMEDAEV